VHPLWLLYSRSHRRQSASPRRVPKPLPPAWGTPKWIILIAREKGICRKGIGIGILEFAGLRTQGTAILE
jgi:hypothetical protein